MGRVSKDQSHRNRRAVVEAASRLLRERGLDGVGLREMMAAAGLTQGAFSGQFASKDALAAEAFALAFEGAERNFSAILEDRSPGQNRRLVEDYFRPKSSVYDCPLATISMDVARSHEDSEVRKTFARGLESLTRVVAGDPPSTDRLVLLAAMVGAVVLRRAGGDTETGKQIEAAVAVFGDEIDQ